MQRVHRAGGGSIGDAAGAGGRARSTSKEEELRERLEYERMERARERQRNAGEMLRLMGFVDRQAGEVSELAKRFRDGATGQQQQQGTHKSGGEQPVRSPLKAVSRLGGHRTVPAAASPSDDETSSTLESTEDSSSRGGSGRRAASSSAAAAAGCAEEDEEEEELKGFARAQQEAEERRTRPAAAAASATATGARAQPSPSPTCPPASAPSAAAGTPLASSALRRRDAAAGHSTRSLSPAVAAGGGGVARGGGGGGRTSPALTPMATPPAASAGHHAHRRGPAAASSRASPATPLAAAAGGGGGGGGGTTSTHARAQAAEREAAALQEQLEQERRHRRRDVEAAEARRQEDMGALWDEHWERVGEMEAACAREVAEARRTSAQDQEDLRVLREALREMERENVELSREAESVEARLRDGDDRARARAESLQKDLEKKTARLRAAEAKQEVLREEAAACREEAEDARRRAEEAEEAAAAAAGSSSSSSAAVARAEELLEEKEAECEELVEALRAAREEGEAKRGVLRRQLRERQEKNDGLAALVASQKAQIAKLQAAASMEAAVSRSKGWAAAAAAAGGSEDSDGGGERDAAAGLAQQTRRVVSRVRSSSRLSDLSRGDSDAGGAGVGGSVDARRLTHASSRLSDRPGVVRDRSRDSRPGDSSLTRHLDTSASTMGRDSPVAGAGGVGANRHQSSRWKAEGSAGDRTPIGTSRLDQLRSELRDARTERLAMQSKRRL